MLCPLSPGNLVSREGAQFLQRNRRFQITTSFTVACRIAIPLLICTKNTSMPPNTEDNPCPYILIIDDDEDDLEMLSSSLEQLGVKTRSFDSGKKAIFFLNLLSDTGDLPDLIITDFNMPSMNGLRILNILKDNKETSFIPVVVYSTHMTPIFKNALIKLGAVDCFAKPSVYADFTHQIATFKNLASNSNPLRKILPG
jgi:CheY-like chemotaxis protein